MPCGECPLSSVIFIPFLENGVFYAHVDDVSMDKFLLDVYTATLPRLALFLFSLQVCFAKVVDDYTRVGRRVVPLQDVGAQNVFRF